MQHKYEKLIRSEVARRVSYEHPFFEDLCQEAKVAVLSIESKIDKSLPEKKQLAYVRQAVRWHVTKVWHSWLRESLLVSVRSLREKRADLTKIDRGEDYLRDLVSPEPSPEESLIENDFQEKLKMACEQSTQSERDKKALQGLLDGLDSRKLGKSLGMSHQGALNVQKKLISRIRKVFKKNDRFRSD